MIEEVLPTAEDVARRAAELIAQQAQAFVRAQGRCLLALSGGTTPSRMLERLAAEDLPWSSIHIFQVDERVAPAADPARNLTQLRASLLDKVSLPEENLHAMPVEDTDLGAAAARYAATLREVAGTPLRLDIVHLGLGADGHTASLVPGDPALDSSAEVAVTAPYQGHGRMTLTYPALDHASLILWLVTGRDKAQILARLRRGDRSIPAGRVSTERAILLADTSAATSPT